MLENKENTLENFSRFRSLLKEKHEKIFLILAPPRTSSTALARCFWEIPEIRYYCHEPYEIIYYQKKPEIEAFYKIMSPIDLSKEYRNKKANSKWLLIKEMPYQVGVDDEFKRLIEIITEPVLILLRDPRLNIMSRIRKRMESNQEVYFPLIETGWFLIEKQLELLQNIGQKFYILDSSLTRNNSDIILPKLLSHLGIKKYNLNIWYPADNINLDNLEGQHSHLYTNVLQSSQLNQEDKPIPQIDDFPDYFRNHVLECLNIYEKLLKHPNSIGIK
jgi:hypothetical protein